MSLTLAQDIDCDECGPYDMSCQGGQFSQPVVKACHPSFANKTMRLRTFDTWPLTLPGRETMAAAGFYYTGNADCVVCYHCGKGLKDWVATDNPWEEHKKYFPDCAILKRRRPSITSNPTRQESGTNAVTGSQSSSEHAVPDSLLCKICFQNQMCITFLPCKHVVTCETCAESMKECAVCRTKIRDSLKVYLQ